MAVWRYGGAMALVVYEAQSLCNRMELREGYPHRYADMSALWRCDVGAMAL
jgi:hypothetical protein